MNREELMELEKRYIELGRELTEARRSVEPETVSDYELRTLEGPVSLSGLFGEQDHLIVVHNMGKGCPYCTLWADGFTGLHDHLLSRAAFVVSSPDSPEVQREFAESRGWPFRMVSTQGSEFAGDMGYQTEQGGPLPGVSVFHRNEDGSAVRTGHGPFGPGDQFCPVWHFFDLLGNKSGDWAPEYSY